MPNMDEVVRQPVIDKVKLLDSIRLNIDYYQTLKQSSKTSSEELYSVGRMDSYSILVRAIESGELDCDSNRLLIEEREQDKAEIERLNGRLKWMEQIDMDRQADFELHAKSLRNSAIKVAEQDKEIQRYKSALERLDDRKNGMLPRSEMARIAKEALDQ